jgi:hypothetical protein
MLLVLFWYAIFDGAILTSHYSRRGNKAFRNAVFLNAEKSYVGACGVQENWFRLRQSARFLLHREFTEERQMKTKVSSTLMLGHWPQSWLQRRFQTEIKTTHCGGLTMDYVVSLLKWRRGPESNRSTRLCRPLHNRFATPP